MKADKDFVRFKTMDEMINLKWMLMTSLERFYIMTRIMTYITASLFMLLLMYSIIFQR
jgi:hypothetical protein